MDVLVVRQQNPEAEGKRDAWSMEEDLHLLKVYYVKHLSAHHD